MLSAAKFSAVARNLSEVLTLWPVPKFAFHTPAWSRNHGERSHFPLVLPGPHPARQLQ